MNKEKRPSKFVKGRNDLCWAQLKNLDANGIFTRQVFATVPPAVEFALTSKGEKLLASIRSLYQWGQEFTS